MDAVNERQEGKNVWAVYLASESKAEGQKDRARCKKL